MRKKNLLAKIAACAMALTMAATPVMADDIGVTKDTIDVNKTGSITIYKLKENSGNTSEGDGLKNDSETREGMKNIVFTQKKIADFINVPGNSNQAAGIYFTNLDTDFTDMITSTFADVDLSGTVIDGTTYYTTDQMERILAAVEAENGDGKTYTGDTKIADYITDGGTDFAATDENGMTKLDGLPVGLYLIAETGYYDLDADGTYKKVYRTHTYAANGVESDTTNTVNTDDRNYNDSSETFDNPTAEPSGTQNPEVVDNPSSPFLVSVPTTNLAEITSGGVTYEPGTVWQYDITTYPKNSTTSISKRVIDDDGDTLDQFQDYHIGQNIHQVIWSDVPATMFTKDNGTRKNTEYNITDTMSKGLTFQKITRVAYGTKVASPAKASDFDNFTALNQGTDYTIDWITSSGAATVDNTNVGAVVANGVQNVQGFTIKLTKAGLKKLDDVDQESQVLVEFDTVLNKDAVIGSQDGKTFNVNYPTLTFRNQNTLERKVEGNEVKLYTYELDLTKTGSNILAETDQNGKEQIKDHDFNAGDVSFTVQQVSQKDPFAYGANAQAANHRTVETKDAYLTFVREADGVYHVWTPADGTVKNLIKYDTKKDADGKYNATAVDGVDEGIDATQIISPAHSVDKDGNVEEGKLIIKGLDSEDYTFTEKSTSSHFNLLKSTFNVKLTAPGTKDGNLIPNTDATSAGATLTTDGKTTMLNHDKGIVTMTVNNYKAITLHTGSIGTGIIYIAAAGFAVLAIFLFVRDKKKKQQAA